MTTTQEIDLGLNAIRRVIIGSSLDMGSRYMENIGFKRIERVNLQLTATDVYRRKDLVVKLRAYRTHPGISDSEKVDEVIMEASD